LVAIGGGLVGHERLIFKRKGDRATGDPSQGI
jgi:hypothetical protein